jgi:hypothetical protein
MAGWLIGAGVLAVAVLSGLALWLLARDRRAGPQADGAGWVLRPSRALLPVLGVLGLATSGFAAGTVAALAEGRFGPVQGVLAIAALTCAGGLALVDWHRRVFRLRYDAEGLALQKPGNAPVACRWEDLADIRLETRQHRGSMAGPPMQVTHLVARRPGGAELRIPATLVGFTHFSDFALRKADRLGNRGHDRDA